MKNVSIDRLFAVPALLLLASSLLSVGSDDGRVAPASRRRPDANQDPPRPAGLQELVLPEAWDAPFQLSIDLGGKPCSIHLEPFHLRTPDFRFLVEDAAGIHPQPLPPASTHRGRIVGRPRSRVTASLWTDGLRATIDEGEDGEVWEVLPAGARHGARIQHLVRRADDRPDPAITCGVFTSGPAPAGGSPQPLEGDPRICEIALDCDYEEYVSHGPDPLATVAFAESILNEAAPPFEDDLGIVFRISAILVRTSQEADPYQAYGGSILELLKLFGEHWEANHDDVPRDMVHLFTRKSWSENYSGYAYLGSAGQGVCTCLAYSLSHASGYALFWGSRLLAHEIGHVLGATHCDGDEDCWIMCGSTLGPCQGTSTYAFAFGTSAQADILQGISNLACLTETLPAQPPVLDGVSPTQVPVLSATPVTVSGSGLGDVKGMRVVAPWGQIDTDLCDAQIVDDTMLLLSPPVPLALGTVQLAALSGQGSSNGVAFEYIATDPPQLIVPVGKKVPGTLTWKAAALPGQEAVLLVSYDDPATTTSGGFTVLANGAPVFLGDLDAVGFATYSRFLPGSLADGDLYSQLTVYDESGSLVGVSEIETTHLSSIGPGGGDPVD